MTHKIIIREISENDDTVIASIIKKVGEEFGAIGDGFGPSDAEVNEMSKHYTPRDKSIYLIAELNEVIVGGCGIAQFNNEKEVCELKKLFLLPYARGHNIGNLLVENCLNFASKSGYSKCYLDTLSNMKSAIYLYKKLGFETLDKPYGESIHTGCDVWMIKSLSKIDSMLKKEIA